MSSEEQGAFKSCEVAKTGTKLCYMVRLHPNARVFIWSPLEMHLIKFV